ncbi:MAG: SHOCT domain-containing protein [Alphaproteobacteria bacterium]|nr:SHOCT domain-containing protein [Alphaproteobacteria bacterium]
MMSGGAWGGMIFGSLFMIVVLVGVIGVVVLLLRWLGGAGPGTGSVSPGPPSRTPLDILKERFARGDIDQEEFEERRRVLDR